MADGIADDGEFFQFYATLVSKTMYTCRDQIVCGSISELPLWYLLQNPTDIDVMTTSSPTVVALPGDFVTPHIDGFTFARISTYRVHPGYARLVYDGNEITYGDLLRGSLPWHGPAYQRHRVHKSSLPESLLTGLVIIDEIIKALLNAPRDEVHAILCPVWPLEAAEWATRIRQFGWPPSSVVEHVVGIGCYLVFMPHKMSLHPTSEFRLSFSKAETILINTWKPQQKFCYHILRQIKRYICQSQQVSTDDNRHNTILCTYHLKTLMLWSCEERPPEFWDYNRLTTSIQEILCCLIGWMIEKTCPNYFVPQNHMMDHISDDEQLQQEINLLRRFVDEVELRSLLKDNIPAENVPSVFRLLFPISHLKYMLSIWISSFLTLSERRRCLHAILDEECFRQTFYHLFSGLKYQRYFESAKSRLTTEDAESLLLLSENCLKLSENYLSAYYEDVSAVIRVDVSLSDSIFGIGMHIHEYLKRIQLNIEPIKTCPTDKSHKGPELFERNTINDSVYSSIEIKPLIFHSRTRIYCRDEKLLNASIQSQSALFRDVFGNNNFFQSILSNNLLVSVYLANFYYVSRNEWTKALYKCVEIGQYVNNEIVLEAHLFPVILSSRWTAIFDEEIQAILGFLFLSGNVRWPTATSVTLCPHHFAAYVEIRCLMAMGSSKDVIINKYFDIFCGDMKCHLFSNHEILEFALRIAGLWR